MALCHENADLRSIAALVVHSHLLPASRKDSDTFAVHCTVVILIEHDGAHGNNASEGILIRLTFGRNRQYPPPPRLETHKVLD